MLATHASVRRLYGIGVAALFAVATAAADITLPETVQVHGFLSQAYLRSSANRFFGGSDEGSLKFRELGVNASWHAQPQLQLAAQMISRRAGATDDGQQRLDYGLIDYTPVSDEFTIGGVRLGRLKVPLGLYNETRDVAHTRPSILLPQSVYLDPLRNVFLSVDGGSLYGERRTGIGDFYLDVVRGRGLVDNQELEVTALGRDWAGKLESDPATVARLLYESDARRWRLAFTGINVPIRFKPGSGDLVTEGKYLVDVRTLSVQYDAALWSLTAERQSYDVRLRDLGFLLPDTTKEPLAHYVQGTLRFASRWEALLRYDVLYWDRYDKDGALYAAQTGRPAHSQFAKDWTAGVSWSLTRQFMLRAEVHHVDGTAWLPNLDNPDRSVTERRWNLYALQAAYRF